MSIKKVLLVDDKNNLIEFIVKTQYSITIAESETIVYRVLAEQYFDLILISSSISGIDAILLTKRLRTKLKLIIPIVLIGGYKDDSFMINALDSGADDYISDTSSLEYLVSRINAHLRRSEMNRWGKGGTKITLSEGLEVDMITRVAWVDGAAIPLSLKEFEILYHLYLFGGKVVSLEELCKVVWGKENNGDPRTLLVHVSNLRKKIETQLGGPKYIITVRGAGYMFNNRLNESTVG
ncbi:response regulator transcription factor [Paenibacillus sp. GYB003]|uniref:response regulator transcription factor n=1 Tax=Paenibacillus sp. GYB003 TaxID=2994392 RepID=UPI002F962A9B